MNTRRPENEPEATLGERKGKGTPQTPWVIEVRYVAVRRCVKSGQVAEQLGPFETPGAAEKAVVALN